MDKEEILSFFSDFYGNAVGNILTHMLFNKIRMSKYSEEYKEIIKGLQKSDLVNTFAKHNITDVKTLYNIFCYSFFKTKGRNELLKEVLSELVKYGFSDADIVMFMSNTNYHLFKTLPNYDVLLQKVENLLLTYRESELINMTLRELSILQNRSEEMPKIKVSLFKKYLDNNDFLAIDVETTPKPFLQTNIKSILYGCYDTKNGEKYVINDIKDLPSKINGRLLVGHNIFKYDLKIMINDLATINYILVKTIKYIKSSQNEILTIYVFKRINSNDYIHFGVYDSVNLMRVPLKDIAKLLIDGGHISSDYAKGYRIPYSQEIVDKLNVFFSDSLAYYMSVVNIHSDFIDISGFINYVNKMREGFRYDGQLIYADNDNIVKAVIMLKHGKFDVFLKSLPFYTIIPKGDVGEELLLAEQEMINILSMDTEYGRYAINDAFISAYITMHANSIFTKILNKHDINVVLDKKLTISGLAYQMSSQVIKQAIQNKILKEGEGYIELLNNFRKAKYSRKFEFYNVEKNPYLYKSINDVDFYYTNQPNKLYVNMNNNAYLICTSRIEIDAWKPFYKGGIVYAKQGEYKGELRKYDINSSYPFAMSVMGINPFARILHIPANGNIDPVMHELLQKTWRYLDKLSVEQDTSEVMHSKPLDYIRELYANWDMTNYALSPMLDSLFRHAVEGRVIIHVVCDVIKADGRFGLMLKNKETDKNVNCYVKQREEDLTFLTHAPNKPNNYVRVSANLLDLISANAVFVNADYYVMMADLTEFSATLNKIYNLRQQYKKEGSELQLVFKLLMNSAYGKYGSTSNTSIYESTIFFGDDFIENAVNCVKRENPRYQTMVKNALSESGLSNITTFEELSDGYTTEYVAKNGKVILKKDGSHLIMSIVNKGSKRKDANVYYFWTSKLGSYVYFNCRHEVVQPYQDLKYSLPIASGITAYARANLSAYYEQVVRNGGEVLYADTDSLITTAKIPETKELGGMKCEKEFKFLVVAGKKMYRTDNVCVNKGISNEAVENYLRDTNKYVQDVLLHDKQLIITDSRMSSNSVAGDTAVTIVKKKLILMPYDECCIKII